MSSPAFPQSAAPTLTPAGEGWGIQVGRTFLHPIFDYMAIGGGLSLAVAIPVWLATGGAPLDVVIWFPGLVLLTNYSHFAASTLRLYTKPDAFKMVPFLTMVFPAITILVVTFGILFAEALGPQLFKLVMSWSPFHYSAQAYGLAVMYIYRSGLKMTGREKWLLWLCCMMTFFKTLFAQHDLGGGVWWVIPYSAVEQRPVLTAGLGGIIGALNVLSLLLPVAFFYRLSRNHRMRIPAISILLVLTNAIWFVFFPLMGALVATTIFHGIQYMAIATIFHVKDQMFRPGNRKSAIWHAGFFFLACVAFAYGIFSCWPQAYRFAGLGYFESAFVVFQIINLHHFIVDAFIWKLGTRDSNSRVVAAG